MKARHSFRTQLIVVFVAAMCVTMGITVLICQLFLGKFYRSQKLKKLEKTYETVDALASRLDPNESDETFSAEVTQLSVQDNIEILVADVDLQDGISTTRDSKELAIRLFGYYTGYYRDKINVIRTEDTYTIQETTESRIQTNFLEMWGQLSNGYWFLIRTPLESITNAAALSNFFYVAVGIIVTVVAVFVMLLVTRRLSAPIVQLSVLSRKMANLDFETRYTGNAGNEIDELGQNFNRMSEELEQTISELKAANVELTKDVERKTQVDEMRKEFLNNVSHELKTPIALIQGYAEGLRDNVAGDEESRAFYCEVIIDEAQKMNNLVKKLLTLNHLEFGNEKVSMERFDLVQLIKGVLQGMRLLFEEKEAKLSFPYSEPIYVWGDEFQIEEVVTNYLSNALNHLDGERRVEISIETANGLATTSVFNTGEQIPPEDLGKIWDKFYKVDKARTREYGGSGIGLSIVKAIVEGHGQKCWAENRPDGVVFYFTMGQ